MIHKSCSAKPYLNKSENVFISRLSLEGGLPTLSRRHTCDHRIRHQSDGHRLSWSSESESPTYSSQMGWVWQLKMRTPQDIALRGSR